MADARPVSDFRDGKIHMVAYHRLDGGVSRCGVRLLGATVPAEGVPDELRCRSCGGWPTPTAANEVLTDADPFRKRVLDFALWFNGASPYLGIEDSTITGYVDAYFEVLASQQFWPATDPKPED